jgi:hypothetical protein
MAPLSSFNPLAASFGDSALYAIEELTSIVVERILLMLYHRLRGSADYSGPHVTRLPENAPSSDHLPRGKYFSFVIARVLERLHILGVLIQIGAIQNLLFLSIFRTDTAVDGIPASQAEN